MKSRIKEQGSALHIVIVVVLVVALLGALGFIFWQNFINKPNDTQASVEQTNSEQSAPSSEDNSASFVSKDFMTSDNFGITYKIPSTWTGGSYGGGDTLSDSETTKLTSPDGFVITMTISRLVRGWTQDSQSFEVLETQKQNGTDLSWLVVASNPISLQINSAQDLPGVGSKKVAGSSIYKLGEIDGEGVYLEVYGSYEQDMSLDDFVSTESVKQAKLIFESIKL